MGAPMLLETWSLADFLPVPSPKVEKNNWRFPPPQTALGAPVFGCRRDLRLLT